MTTSMHETEESFLNSAREAIRRDPGLQAFEDLGVWEMLGDLEDAEARTALFSAYRAHGRELGGSSALACLLAHPFLAESEDRAGSVAMAIPRRSARRGDILLLVGDPSIEYVLVDRLGEGAGRIARSAVSLEPVEVSGRLPVYEISFDPHDLDRAAVSEEVAMQARPLSAFLGRLAASVEILGAAEGAFEIALEHAKTREQFGEPIGRFQAVRHLLAWARTDCAAVHEVCRQAAALDRGSPPRFDEILKALAGRNGRRVCERALQVLGGIGFTAEHDHHHYHSRVLLLDALLGSSAELARDLGRGMREGRMDPQTPRSLLCRGAGR